MRVCAHANPRRRVFASTPSRHLRGTAPTPPRHPRACPEDPYSRCLMSAHPADAPGVWILATRARMTGSRGPHPQHPPAPLAPRPTSPVVILGLVPRIQTPGPDTGAPCGHTERMDPRHKGEDDGKWGSSVLTPSAYHSPFGKKQAFLQPCLPKSNRGGISKHNSRNACYEQ